MKVKKEEKNEFHKGFEYEEHLNKGGKTIIRKLSGSNFKRRFTKIKWS